MLLKRVLFLGGIFVLGVLLVALLVALLELLGLPSEISTRVLTLVLAGVVVLSGATIWIVLALGRSMGWARVPHRRLAIAGVGLLSVGTALSFALLPEHNATGTVSGAVGVLPPWPAKQDRGFAVGLATHLQGCNDSVAVKIVANGSSAYWAEHDSHSNAWLPFVIVLPGHFSNLRVGLGRIDTTAVGDPEQVNMVKAAEDQLSRVRVMLPGKRDLTVVAGRVRGWSQTLRPVIVTADAQWITRRGVNDCNLQLPALAGEPSALVVAEALTCRGLNQDYEPGTCTDPPPDAGDGAPQNAISVSPSLDVSEGVAMVTGSSVSGPESVPQPVEVDESPGWRCQAPSPKSAAQLSTGSAEVGSGSANASVANQGTCHAVATVLASSWHRDFLLVLIGALMAVGVHMMFQAMVDSPAWRRHHHPHTAGPQEPPSQPAESTQPTQSMQPSQPAESTQPTQSMQPSQPTSQTPSPLQTQSSPQTPPVPRASSSPHHPSPPQPQTPPASQEPPTSSSSPESTPPPTPPQPPNPENSSG